MGTHSLDYISEEIVETAINQTVYIMGRFDIGFSVCRQYATDIDLFNKKLFKFKICVKEEDLKILSYDDTVKKIKKIIKKICSKEKNKKLEYLKMVTFETLPKTRKFRIRDFDLKHDRIKKGRSSWAKQPI